MAETITEIPVVIIGNGPSGLAASALLSGWRPHYDAAAGHPSRAVHHALLAQGDGGPIKMGELAEHSDGLDLPHTSNGACSPAARLMDALLRPDADMGHEHPPAVTWLHSAEAAVRHVCIGGSAAGGSWHDFGDSAPTVSPGTWFDLPGPPMAGATADRTDSALVKAYFEAYPKLAGIDQYQMPFTMVTRLDRVENEDGWLVHCSECGDGGKSLMFKARFVVFAAGVAVPVALGLPAERALHASDRLAYTLSQLKRMIVSHGGGRPTVLVVGDGLSAADAVMLAMVRRARVLHAFRRNARELKSTMLGRISRGGQYCDYGLVHALMAGRARPADVKRVYECCLRECGLGGGCTVPERVAGGTGEEEVEDTEIYTPLAGCEVTAVQPTGDGRVSVRLRRKQPAAQAAGGQWTVDEDGGQSRELLVDFAAALLGSTLGTSLLPYSSESSALTVDRKRLRVDARTYECADAGLSGVHAVGRAAGDNFVRFMVGGCAAAVENIRAKIG